LKTVWKKAMDRHASAARGLKAIVHGVALSALVVGGAYWTLDHEAAKPGTPGDLLKLPGVIASAPVQAMHSVVSPRPAAPMKGSLAAGIGQVLRRYTRDGALADRIATAIVHEGTAKHINPILLVGVVLTENAKLQPAARSNVRATGLMQVMPFHSGKWGCGSGDLVNVESNICHGTSILADLMKRKGSLRSALQGYNGCVRGTNTPHCSTYTGKVLSFANQTSRELAKIRAKQGLDHSGASQAD
jgi:hypothetical protein